MSMLGRFDSQHCEADHTKTSLNIVEQEAPVVGLLTADSKVDIPEYSQSESDFETDVTEEEIMKSCSPTYERGSRFRQPIKYPFTDTWGLPIRDADMKKLKVGFKSRSMDDKHDMLIKDPDEDSDVSLQLVETNYRKSVMPTISFLIAGT